MLASAKRPAVLAGAEIGRFGLQDDLTRLVERLNIPIASTLFGKSVIREGHPLYVGVYGGLIARDEVQQFINDSDCLLILGSILSDLEDLNADSRCGPRAVRSMQPPIMSVFDTIDTTPSVPGLRSGPGDAWSLGSVVTSPSTTPPVINGPPPAAGLASDVEGAVRAPGPKTGPNHARHCRRRGVIICRCRSACASGFEFLSPAYYTSDGFRRSCFNRRLVC